MGLLHTFQVAAQILRWSPDTPTERARLSDVRGPATLAKRAGNDPIHNFMDYTDDACMPSLQAGKQEAWSPMVDYRNTEPFAVSPTSLTFRRCRVPVSADQIVSITDSGGGTLNWSAIVTGEVSWLTATPSPAPALERDRLGQ